MGRGINKTGFLSHKPGFSQRNPVTVSHKPGFSHINRVTLFNPVTVEKNRVYVRETGFMWEKPGLCERNPVYVRETRFIWESAGFHMIWLYTSTCCQPNNRSLSLKVFIQVERFVLLLCLWTGQMTITFLGSQTFVQCTCTLRGTAMLMRNIIIPNWREEIPQQSAEW